jgi:phosphoribosylformylglycinamidine cyclo-ligase
VSSLDGVGTKTRLAARRGAAAQAGLGRDLVNHCVNDVAVQGARPLFFLDYLAFARLDPGQVAELVRGMAAACREAGCALVGGETAEMPSIYREGEYDVAGCLVGVVEAADLIDGRTIRAGDVLLGLPSLGLHTNGFSLALRLLPELERGQAPEGVEALVDKLLAPHRSYLGEITRLCAAGAVHGLAHITGGGIPGNLARILPAGLAARVDAAAWTVPPLFRQLQEAGGIGADEMYRVFNMGIGLIAVVSGEALGAAREAAPEAMEIGRVVEARGDGGVIVGAGQGEGTGRVGGQRGVVVVDGASGS